MNELPGIIAKIHPDVVGISLRNIDSVFSFNKRSYYSPFVSMIRVIRKNAPLCKVVVGGTGFSIFAEEIMNKNPAIDLGMVSEGECSFAELLENLNQPERVKNLVVRKEGRLLFTGKREWADFNRLPFPSRNFFDFEKYKKYPFSVGVQSKRGCVFGCVFCSSRLIWGCSLRLRPPDKVVDEIEMLANDFGLQSFSFAESIFNFPLSYSRELCKEIVRRKLEIKWAAAFNPAFMNRPFAEEAVKAGCDLFSFSPDGASNNSMRLLGKDFGMASVEKTIALARQTDGFNVGYSFLYDLPDYNGEHVLGLFRLASKMTASLGSKLRFLSFSKLRIFPNTPLYETALNHGKIEKNSDLLFPTYYESDSPINPASLLPNALRGSLIVFDKARRKLIGDSTFKFCS
jgi:radical SAM superfamily enzyme YgiQ (UPF0313 family)